MDMNNGAGAAMYNPNDGVAIAQDKVARAHNQHGYALRAFKNTLKADGGAGYDADDAALDALVAATQALNRAKDELDKVVMARRFSHVRSVMRELSKIYRRIERLSRRYGANFQCHRIAGKTGILQTKARLIRELKDEFEELSWNFSAIDPGFLPKNLASHEERHLLVHDISIYWATLSADGNKPWSSA